MNMEEAFTKRQLEGFVQKKTQFWAEGIHASLKFHGIRQVSYVPDAGHSRLINLCRNDEELTTVVLTTEEEGVAMATGAWLGGEKSVLLMQSSGIGNCINMFSMIRECKIPFFTVITMRGEKDEFNPWQRPLGQNAEKSTTGYAFRTSGENRQPCRRPTSSTNFR